MCLFCDGKLWKADKDIECWKTMWLIGENKFRSLYYYQEYDSGNTYSNYLRGYEKAFIIKPNLKWKVQHGIHTYDSLASAIFDCDYNPKSMDFVFVKCKIPKGATYYKGVNRRFTPCYASDKLYITDEYKPVTEVISGTDVCKFSELIDLVSKFTRNEGGYDKIQYFKEVQVQHERWAKFSKSQISTLIKKK